MVVTRKQIIVSGIVIIVLFAGFFFLNGRSLRKAKELTRELEVQVDSLHGIASDYLKLQEEYEQLFENLNATREKADEFKNKVNEITRNQASSVSRLKNELNRLVQEFDTLDLDVPLDTANLDSLKF